LGKRKYRIVQTGRRARYLRLFGAGNKDLKTCAECHKKDHANNTIFCASCLKELTKYNERIMKKKEVSEPVGATMGRHYL